MNVPGSDPKSIQTPKNVTSAIAQNLWYSAADFSIQKKLCHLKAVDQIIEDD